MSGLGLTVHHAHSCSLGAEPEVVGSAVDGQAQPVENNGRVARVLDQLRRDRRYGNDKLFVPTLGEDAGDAEALLHIRAPAVGVPIAGPDALDNGCFAACGGGVGDNGSDVDVLAPFNVLTLRMLVT